MQHLNYSVSFRGEPGHYNVIFPDGNKHRQLSGPKLRRAQYKLKTSFVSLVICCWCLWTAGSTFTQTSRDNNAKQALYLERDNYILVCSSNCPQDANVGYLFTLDCCDVPPEISLWTKGSLGARTWSERSSEDRRKRTTVGDRGNAAAAAADAVFLWALRRFSFCPFFRHTCALQFTRLSASRPILKLIAVKLRNEKFDRFSKEVSWARFKSVIYLEGMRKFPERFIRGSRYLVRDMNRVTTTPNIFSSLYFLLNFNRG